MGMLGAEWTFAADVLVEPGVVHDVEIRATETAPESVAADAAPRRVMIGAARMEARTANVEKVREVVAQPRARVVLVGDGIHAQLRDQPVHRLWRAGLTKPPKGLGENVGSAPSRDP